jgi:hypothetical protein|tara:strand:- start:387 stop:560 length:174 start_codon:yes stop_codon:yes gene_type:complete
MTDVKVFEFSPDEAIELGASVAGGVQKVLDDYTNGKAVEGITSYVMAGNLYVVVTTT